MILQVSSSFNKSFKSRIVCIFYFKALHKFIQGDDKICIFEIISRTFIKNFQVSSSSLKFNLCKITDIITCCIIVLILRRLFLIGQLLFDLITFYYLVIKYKYDLYEVISTIIISTKKTF